MAERRLPYEVPELKYVDLTLQQVRRDTTRDLEWELIHDRASGTYKAGQTPIAPCVRCGHSASDPTRDAYGGLMPEHFFDSEEEKEAVCSDCRDEEMTALAQEELMLVLEDKLGLAERHRDALKSFIETIFTDPKKILQLQDLHNRMRSLQTQINVLWAAVGGAIITLFVLVVTMMATR